MKTKKIIFNSIFVAVALFAFGMLLKLEHTYQRQVKVISIDDNIISCEDINGYIWTFNGDDYKIGQDLTLIMHDNNTGIIEDDYIIKVR